MVCIKDSGSVGGESIVNSRKISQFRNGKEFCLEKKFGTVNYSRAVVKTDSGTTIIYDATDASLQQAVWLAMYFGALLVAVVTGLIITMKRLRQARK